MTTDVQLAHFEGPLDLLLQLIEEEKLAITDIALAEVTEQYLRHLSTLEESHPEALADFLVVAARLVYLKSKQLLPLLYPDEAAEGPSLAEQLKLYKQYVEASRRVQALWLQGKMAYGRVEPPFKVDGFVLPTNADMPHVQAAFHALLKRLKPLPALPQVAIDRSISLKQKIESIYEALVQHKKIMFSTIFSQAENKTEVIVSFLALLELVKQERAMIDQENVFADMLIRHIN